MAVEPSDLRFGQRKSGDGRDGSNHGRHGRIECVLAGLGVKNIEHFFDCGAAGRMRGRRGGDRAEALFVDRQKIQRM